MHDLYSMTCSILVYYFLVPSVYTWVYIGEINGRLEILVYNIEIQFVRTTSVDFQSFTRKHKSGIQWELY